MNFRTWLEEEKKEWITISYKIWYYSGDAIVRVMQRHRGDPVIVREYVYEEIPKELCLKWQEGPFRYQPGKVWSLIKKYGKLVSPSQPKPLVQKALF